MGRSNLKYSRRGRGSARGGGGIGGRGNSGGGGGGVRRKWRASSRTSSSSTVPHHILQSSSHALTGPGQTGACVDVPAEKELALADTSVYLTQRQTAEGADNDLDEQAQSAAAQQSMFDFDASALCLAMLALPTSARLCYEIPLGRRAADLPAVEKLLPRGTLGESGEVTATPIAEEGEGARGGGREKEGEGEGEEEGDIDSLLQSTRVHEQQDHQQGAPLLPSTLVDSPSPPAADGVDDEPCDGDRADCPKSISNAAMTDEEWLDDILG